MEKRPRFFDEGDFTSEHENIHLWAIEQFPKFNAYRKIVDSANVLANNLTNLLKRSKTQLELKDQNAWRISYSLNHLAGYWSSDLQLDRDVAFFECFGEREESLRFGFKEDNDSPVIYLSKDNLEELTIKRENQLKEMIKKQSDRLVRINNALKEIHAKGWLGDYSGELVRTPKFDLEPVLKGYPPVYPDCILELDSGETLVIEIKSHIYSFEPVLRQVQIYKSRVGISKVIFMLIYPEKYSKYDSIFRTQNIEIVHCPDSLIEIVPDVSDVSDPVLDSLLN